MTIDEAIERLKTDIYKYADFTENPNENEFWMAFDMAIKALEREQCEDAVSRQAVLDKKELVQLEDGQSFYCISPEDVETLPSVTPKPKTGHWIRQTDDYHDYYECEHCGIAVGLDDIKNYCPNCGAKMVEPQESEE